VTFRTSLACALRYIFAAVSTSSQKGLLAEAARRLGREELARRLKVPEALLDTWMNGHATMPERKFILLVDLLDHLSAP
jgi:hypothetical protein